VHHKIKNSEIIQISQDTQIRRKVAKTQQGQPTNKKTQRCIAKLKTVKLFKISKFQISQNTQIRRRVAKTQQGQPTIKRLKGASQN